MKVKLLLKILIFGFFVAQFRFVSGQITITKSNMPVAGQNYIYTTSDDSIDVSATGADTAWDFSQITPVSQDTYKYVSAAKANILYSIQFSGDVALNEKIQGLTGAYQFFNTAATEYTQQGLGVTLPVIKIPVSIPYTSPDVIYRFPLTYGKKDSASFTGTTTLTSGVTIKIVGKRINLVNGWGKVITPYKTYSCIRVVSFVEEIDSFLGTAINNSRIEYKWLSTSEQIPVFEAVVPKGTAGGGMTLYYRDSFHNVVNPNGPVVGFSVPDTNVFINDTVTFNNTTSGALTYSWDITPSTFTYVTGSTTASKNPQIIFNKSGLYTVSLNATGIGGTNYLTKTDYIDATHNSGIEPMDNAINELELYPNPCLDNVQVNIGQKIIGNDLCSIINASGKIVYSGTVNMSNGLTNISLKDCVPGLYLIRIQDGEKVFEGKVVKE